MKSCIDGEEGDKLILNYGQITINVDIPYTPHIRFNGAVNETLELYAVRNFLGTVCLLLTEKPKVCENHTYDFE